MSSVIPNRRTGRDGAHLSEELHEGSRSLGLGRTQDSSDRKGRPRWPCRSSSTKLRRSEDPTTSKLVAQRRRSPESASKCTDCSDQDRGDCRERSPGQGRSEQRAGPPQLGAPFLASAGGGLQPWPPGPRLGHDLQRADPRRVVEDRCHDHQLVHLGLPDEPLDPLADRLRRSRRWRTAGSETLAASRPCPEALDVVDRGRKLPWLATTQVRRTTAEPT